MTQSGYRGIFEEPFSYAWFLSYHCLAILSQSAVANSLNERLHLNLSKAIKIIHPTGKCMQPVYNWSTSCRWVSYPFDYAFELCGFTVCSVFIEIYRAFTNLMFRLLEFLTNLTYVLHLMTSDKWTIKLQLVNRGALWSMVLLFPVWLPLVMVEYWVLFRFVFLLCLPTTITTASPLTFPLACSLHSLNLTGVLLPIAEDEEQNSDPTNSWRKACIPISKTYLKMCLNYSVV